MDKRLIILIAVALVIGLGFGVYFIGFGPKGQTGKPAVGGPRPFASSVPERGAINVVSEYSTVRITVTDKDFINGYINQSGLWDKKVTLYDYTRQDMPSVGQHTISSITFSLSTPKQGLYHFNVGNLGTFREIYPANDDPRGVSVAIEIDPNFIATASEADLAKRFSDVALSAVNFITQGQPSNATISVVDTPQTFLQVTRFAPPTPQVIMLQNTGNPADFPVPQY